jgi:RNA polymerase sigma-70 factor (ECF subfamily)
LQALHAADLYLACGCSLGDPSALAEFDARHLSQIGAFVAHIRTEPIFVDELRQFLREKLLLGNRETPPKIVDYAGRGPLGGWVRIAAIRTAYNLLRSTGTSPSVDPFDAAGSDPELDFLKAQYLDDFRNAFEQALAVLAADDRNLLRLHYLDGLTTVQLATLFHIDKSNVSRKITRVRAEIVARTRSILGKRLRLESTELDSIVALVQSQLDVSIRRFLKP